MFVAIVEGVVEATRKGDLRSAQEGAKNEGLLPLGSSSHPSCEPMMAPGGTRRRGGPDGPADRDQRRRGLRSGSLAHAAALTRRRSRGGASTWRTT
jgi:hypothetical protein